jgi:hypothetical protein
MRSRSDGVRAATDEREEVFEVAFFLASGPEARGFPAYRGGII